MGHISATVTDVTETKIYECMLPADRSVGQIAARLAELTNLPIVGPDNYPVNYSLIVKGGAVLESDSILADVRLQGSAFRLIPELVAGQDMLNFPTDDVDEIADEEEQPEEPVDVRIINERSLVEVPISTGRPDVRIDAEVHREIEQFAGKDRFKECAGILLGHAFVEGNKRVIHITAIIPAYDAEGSRTSVRISAGDWESMLRIRDTKHCGLQILGWFHTHAGWGVFLSDSDYFIHRHFFSHPDMVAYVLDPTVGRDGFFFWHEGKISQSPNYGLVCDQPVKRRTTSTRRKRHKHVLRNLILLLILIAAASLAIIRPPFMKSLFDKSNSTRAALKIRHHQKRKPVKLTIQVYTMQEGENLWMICRRFYGSGNLSDALASYNGIDNRSSVRAGQEIKLPPKPELVRLSSALETSGSDDEGVE